MSGTGTRIREPQGWYADPFGRHEQRYFSDGQPTTLVRTRGVEAHDTPEMRVANVDPQPAPPEPASQPSAPTFRPQLYEVRRHRILGPLVFIVLVGAFFAGAIGLSAMPLATVELLAVVIVALAILVLTRSRQRAA